MNRINEVILKMNEFIREIELKAIEHSVKLEENEKLQVNAIATKTIDTINNSIGKLEEMKTQVTDETQLEDFLQRLEKKCEDVKNYTIIKIEEIKPIIKEEVINLKEDLEKTFNSFQVDANKQTDEIKEDVKEVVEDTKEDLQEKIQEVKEDVNEIKSNTIEVLADTIDKILNNENVKNVIKFVIDTKDKAVEIYNLPETQEAINNAKLKIIEIAEKGLDTLKATLEKEKDNTL